MRRLHLVAILAGVACVTSANAAVHLVLKAGDAFPGGTVTTINYTAADPSGRRIAIAVTGTIPSRPGATGALLNWEDGRLETLALEGDPLPGGATYGGAYYYFQNALGHVTFNQQGHVYTYDETGAPREILKVADLPAGHHWYTLRLDDVNDNDELLFTAVAQDLPGGPLTSALMLFADGQITQLMALGARSVEGDLIDRFQGAQFNNARQVVFSTGYDAVYRLEGGIIRRVLRKGDPAPGGGSMDDIVQQVIDEAGNLVLVGNFGDELGDEGFAGQLIRVDQSGLHALTVDNTPSPWGARWSSYTAFPAFNRQGELVFEGAFHGGPQQAIVLQRTDGSMQRIIDDYVTPAPWDPAHHLFGLAFPQLSDDRRVTLSMFIEGQPDGGPTVLVQVATDYDGDGIDDPDDPCTDVDGDGLGDAGFPANTCPVDDCPAIANPTQTDADVDGVGDLCDDCPADPDPTQVDTDHDGSGDACDPCTDPDADGRGLPGNVCPPDDCPTVADPDQTDTDGDGVGDACDDCSIFPDPAQDRADVCDAKPLPGLAGADAAAFDDGLEEFADIETPDRGLGPVFNGRSCAECHNQPTIGGSSARFVMRFGADGPNGFDPMAYEGGSLVQANGITTDTCSVPGEVVPPDATVSTRRDSPPLFGLGFIDGIPDERILRLADPTDHNGDGVSGRPNMIAGRVGRFGWKAQVATLRDFAADAYLNEMGITSPMLPNENLPQGEPLVCDTVPDPEDDGSNVQAFTDFMRLLAPLPATKPTGIARFGKRLFRTLRCHVCHSDKLRSGLSDLPALRSKRVRVFSDLLLHDMGSLGDGIAQGQATGSEFRTAPLWGVAFSAPYLHDGRAATLEEAIASHDGEGRAARDRFFQLGPSGRAALVAFLKGL
ncbi:MAG: DUF7453 family protein [Candidatus Binatia bacterium]